MKIHELRAPWDNSKVNRLRFPNMTNSLPPLDGITVLDFSHALAGPYCTMLMAAYGAKVIKVESPEGDIGRTWGPPFHGADASYFVGLNSGKQSLAIDLKTSQGLDACRKLAATSEGRAR
jgi:crotonobetainyl-CoA:carnitine CoA-transferase CaiB-like acyl-CoA transferase